MSPLSPDWPAQHPAEFQAVLHEVLTRRYPDAQASALTQARLRLGFSFRDPDLEVLLDGQSPRSPEEAPAVSFGDAARRGPAPDLRFSMSGPTAHRFWSGELNVVAAMASGQLRLEGSLVRALTLAPMLPLLQQSYRAACARLG
ncbi:hypothetical protein [Deinococcus sonorensis]|uniref:SCP2 domain-containing protein n=2 Tax=Deinococcus sonorensis TaxID=309891 RepID=A0AAU7UCB4_9DEIO